MSAQLLIYETVVPVSAGRHGQFCVEGSGYGFSRHVNAVPLIAVEFLPAAAEYAIVFTGNEEAIMPAAILGMRGRQNTYLDESGGWRARYVPAFIRRYPFVFSSSDDGKRFTLCIDEAYEGVNEEGRGEHLFTDKGNHTAYLDSVLKFLQEYQAQFQRTRIFCDKLKKLDLLEPMQAKASLESGENLSLTGFMGVNRKKLKEIPSEALEELFKTDELELIYLHLHSMRNFGTVRDQVADTTAPPAGMEAAADAADAAESETTESEGQEA
jgi:hypothetical protein